MFMDWKSGATSLSWGKRGFRARLRMRRAQCHGSAQRTHPFLEDGRVAFPETRPFPRCPHPDKGILIGRREPVVDPGEEVVRKGVHVGGPCPGARSAKWWARLVEFAADEYNYRGVGYVLLRYAC